MLQSQFIRICVSKTASHIIDLSTVVSCSVTGHALRMMISTGNSFETLNIHFADSTEACKVQDEIWDCIKKFANNDLMHTVVGRV